MGLTSIDEGEDGAESVGDGRTDAEGDGGSVQSEGWALSTWVICTSHDEPGGKGNQREDGGEGGGSTKEENENQNTQQIEQVS